MRSFGPIERFAAGAVGRPGARTFYLEVDTGDHREWFLLEKVQVAALAERILDLMRPMGIAPQPAGPTLGAALEPTFRVGEIGVGTDIEGLVIVLQSTEDDEPVGFTLSAEQADAAARRALEVVGAGRPPCQLCGRPVDPAGHTCPATNGDLRHH